MTGKNRRVMLIAVILSVSVYLIFRVRGYEMPRGLRLWPLYMVLLYTVLRAVESGTDRRNTLIAGSAVLMLFFAGGIPFSGEIISGVLFLSVAVSLLLWRRSGDPGESDLSTYSVFFDSRTYHAGVPIRDGSVLFALFGSVKFDGSDSSCEEGLFIDAAAIFGEVTIYLPDRCRLTVQETPLLGSVKCTYGMNRERTEDEETDMPREVTVRALAILGEVKIR